MAKIINIETASYVCSVAFAIDGSVVSLKENKEGKSHASSLTVFIEQIFHEQNISSRDLDAIAVSKGPGSYTGLRIGVSAAKGLCYGSSLPLISICSLNSLANGIIQDPEIKNLTAKYPDLILCPMIDARRMEVYTALYNTKLEQISDIQAIIVNETTFIDRLEKHKVIFFGEGAAKCQNVTKHPNAMFFKNLEPSARFMSGLSENEYLNNRFEDTAYFEPFYLKDFVPTTPKKNLIQKIK